MARCLGGLVATRGFLYAVGGTEEMVRASRRLSRYDPRTDSWTDLSPMVEARFDAGQFRNLSIKREVVVAIAQLIQISLALSTMGDNVAVI